MKTFYVIILFAVSVSKLSSQDSTAKKIHYGFGLEYYVSGSAHGGFYSGYLSMSKGKCALTIGPCIQKRSMQMNGLKICFLYKLVGLDDEDKALNTGLIGLKFFSYMQYVDMLPLSYNAAKVETVSQANPQMDWNKVKLSTAEAGFGMELHIRITKAITLKNFLGLSAFYHFNYIEGMRNERTGPALIFGTGINIPRFRM